MRTRSIITEEEKRRILSLHNKQFIKESRLINEQNVSDIQDILVNKLGFNLGKTGKGGKGIDNDLGPITLNAIYSALTNTLASKSTVSQQNNGTGTNTQGGTNTGTNTQGGTNTGTNTQGGTNVGGGTNINTSTGTDFGPYKGDGSEETFQPPNKDVGPITVNKPGLITNPTTNQELVKQQPKKYKVGDYPIWNANIRDNESKSKLAFVQYVLGSQNKFDQLAQCLTKENLTQAGIEVVNDDATNEVTSQEAGSIFELITPRGYSGPMTLGTRDDGYPYNVENIWDIVNPKGGTFKKIFKKIKLGGLDYYLTANQYEAFYDTWLENGSPSIHIRVCGATACSKLSADFDGDCQVLIAELQKLNGPVNKSPISFTFENPNKK
jgi:hypothetical protein